MATVLRPAPRPLLPYVEEAIGALGHFRADCATDLAAKLTELWPRGVSARMLAGADVDHMLTAKGAEDPARAKAAIALRVYCNLRRDEFAASEARWNVSDPKVRLWARKDFVCQVMQGRDQSVFPWRASPILPQPSCDRDYCPCHFTLEFDDD